MGISREQFMLTRIRLLRVMEYLERHLDDDELRLENLADVAHLSRFHFERTYSEKVRETPMATVRRLRLKRARQLLLDGIAPSITTLAVQSGYGSVAAFSRAFSRAFDHPPTGVIMLSDQFENMALIRTPPLDIVNLPLVPIVRRPFSGPAAEVFNVGDEFSCDVVFSKIAPNYRHWVVHPDGWVDPAQWPDKWVRMWHCASTNSVRPTIAGTEHGFLPHGMFARFILTGKRTDIPHLITRVAAETPWQVIEGPMMRFFPSLPHYTPASERVTHFYLAVAPK